MKPLTPGVIGFAQAAQRATGMPSSVALGQYGQESAWGSAMPPGSNNPFGIKAIPGEAYVTSATHEVVGGRAVLVHAKFRKFPSLAEAFLRHDELLRDHAAYAPARKYLEAGPGGWNIQAFCGALTGIYATDPHYGSELWAIICGDHLLQYDYIEGRP